MNKISYFLIIFFLLKQGESVLSQSLSPHNTTYINFGQLGSSFRDNSVLQIKHIMPVSSGRIPWIKFTVIGINKEYTQTLLKPRKILRIINLNI